MGKIIFKILNTDKLLNCITVDTATLKTVHCKQQPESEKASNEGLSLPMHPFLDEDKQQLVVERIIEMISK